MAKRQHDKHPPLVNVFAEFTFSNGKGIEWDAFTVPTFYRKIAASFPTRKQASVVDFGVSRPAGAAQPQFQPSGPPTQQYRFFSADGKTQVQLRENLLEVKQLPPYYEWRRFEPVVVECFSHYVRLWKPDRVDRVLVCSLNWIDIPRLEFRLDEYLNLFPVLPEFPKEPATNIALSYDVKGAQPDDVVTTTLRQYDSGSPEGVTFAIQWEYVATKGLPSDPKQLQSWLGKAHDFLSQLFLSTFTDECRNLFN